MSEGTRARLRAAAAAALAAAAVLMVFRPVLSAGFIDWDDNVNFLQNQGYRGLDGAHLRWMLTATLGGHWLPLTWLTLGLDHAAWGMDPFGYHLTNLLLHAASAAALFFLLRELVAAAAPSGRRPDGTAADLAALAGALLWALHPLRVESVAWVTERRDVLSGFFGLLFLWSHLRRAAAPVARRRAWAAANLLFFTLTALARPNCVTLLGAALLLDFVPLGRFADPRSARAREALREKLPLALVSVLGAAAVVWANRSIGTFALVSGETGVQRLTQMAMGLDLQVRHFLAPTSLSLIYGLSAPASELPRVLAVHAALPLALSVAALVLARRWPALLAAWAYWLSMLLPAHGSVATWSVTNDRYSYLAALAWSALAAVALASPSVAGDRRRRAAAALACAAVLAACGTLTHRRCADWRDDESLWTAAAESPETDSPMPFIALGRGRLARGDAAGARAAYEEGLRRYPASARLQRGLAAARRADASR